MSLNEDEDGGILFKPIHLESAPAGGKWNEKRMFRCEWNIKKHWGYRRMSKDVSIRFIMMIHVQLKDLDVYE